MHDRETHEIAHQLAAIEELLREWDPIGVIEDLKSDGLPPNEYDDYAPYILGMLRNAATVDELTNHLRYCRTRAMGLDPNDSMDIAFAKRIHDSWHHQMRSNHNVV